MVLLSQIICYIINCGCEWNWQTSRYAHSIEWGWGVVIDVAFVGSKPTSHTSITHK